MDFTLSAEEKMIQQSVREFVRRELIPLEGEVLRNEREGRPGLAREQARELQDKAKRLGFWGINTPEEYGGANLGSVATCITLMELGRTFVPFSFGGFADNILYHCNEEQKHRYLIPTIEGTRRSCFALTEPGAGSDAASLRTSARRVDGGFVLDGSKTFITNLGHAGTCIVMARTGGPGASGISAFVVESGTPGFSWGKPFAKMGLNGSPTGELHLQECRVGDDALLGAEGHGFSIAMSALDAGRIGISAQALGLAQGALDDAIEYMGQRQQFGHRLTDYQGLQWMLADMATQVEAARLMVYRAAALCDAGAPFTKEASMAKLFCTDTAMRVTTDAVQLLGGYGFIEEYPVARRMRDAKASQIYEGTNQVQRVVIARQLLR